MGICLYPSTKNDTEVDFTQDQKNNHTEPQVSKKKPKNVQFASSKETPNLANAANQNKDPDEKSVYSKNSKTSEQKRANDPNFGYKGDFLEDNREILDDLEQKFKPAPKVEIPDLEICVFVVKLLEYLENNKSGILEVDYSILKPPKEIENLKTLKTGDDISSTHTTLGKVIKIYKKEVLLNDNKTSTLDVFYCKAAKNFNILIHEEIKSYVTRLIFHYETVNLEYINHPICWSINNRKTALVVAEKEVAHSFEHIIKKRKFDTLKEKLFLIKDFISAVMSLHSLGITYNNINQNSVRFTHPFNSLKLVLSDKIKICKKKIEEMLQEDDVSNRIEFLDYSKLFMNEQIKNEAIYQSTINFFKLIQTNVTQENEYNLFQTPEFCYYSYTNSKEFPLYSEDEENLNACYYTDIWQLGVLISCLFSNKVFNIPIDEFIEDYKANNIPNELISSITNNYIVAFVLCLLQIKRERRPNIFEVAAGFNSLVDKLYQMQEIYELEDSLYIKINKDKYDSFLKYFERTSNAVVEEEIENKQQLK